jgi:hypothetical protein
MSDETCSKRPPSSRPIAWLSGEYVANAMEYVDDGVAPVVSVELDGKNKRIVITDNGRGMDREGLINFFLMHGENQDRKRGRGVEECSGPVRLQPSALGRS